MLDKPPVPRLGLLRECLILAAVAAVPAALLTGGTDIVIVIGLVVLIVVCAFMLSQLFLRRER